MKIKIKYFEKMIGDKTYTVEPIEKIECGDWIDLRVADDVYLKRGDYAQLPLGVAMQLPNGYEAHVAPRSSTFKRYGIIQTNSVGIIDNSYCGDGDEWCEPVYATRDIHIPFNTRICQFRLVKKQRTPRFERVYKLGADRGGFGSTGV